MSDFLGSGIEPEQFLRFNALIQTINTLLLWIDIMVILSEMLPHQNIEYLGKLTSLNHSRFNVILNISD